MVERALVTGGAGFVGANLTRRLLDDGLEVHVLAHDTRDLWRLRGVAVEVHEGSITEADAVDAIVASVRPDWVFHVAAHGAYPHQQDYDRMVSVNVLGTFHLLEALARVGGCAGVVHTGSSSEYGFQDHAPDETERVAPNSPYAVTKCAATHAMSVYAKTHALPACTVRLSSVYGPWEEPTRLLPRLVAAAREGRLPPLASPRTARDFVWVGDAVDGIVRAARHASRAPGAVWNLGSGRQTTLEALVELTRQTFGITARPDWGAFPDRAWDTTTWVANPARAETDLGWWASTDLRAGLRAFSDWLGAIPVADRYRA